MTDLFARTELMFGKDAMKKLYSARIAVFGIGGVGGYVVEALARSGVGALDITDNDTVSITNLNRQIIALHSTVGRYKSDVMEERIHDINPDCTVRKYKTFFMPDTKDMFDFSQYDYVVDAIDTVTGKKELILSCRDAETPIICSMGAGNKTDPTAFEVSDIYSTSVCPLARVMRNICRKNGIRSLKVVYSKEHPIQPVSASDEEAHGNKTIPGSNAFVPPAAGLIIAGEVIKDITGYNKSPKK